jgi:hypothetical protein
LGNCLVRCHRQQLFFEMFDTDARNSHILFPLSFFLEAER